MAIKTPLICEIAPDTYAINEFGTAAMYLLVGKERALLIDTGCGICDLKAVVDSLTDKPLTVAATHGHMDHVGGMGCFKEMYINEKDWEMTKSVAGKADEIKSYADSFGKSGGYEIYDYSPDRISENIAVPKLLPLREGQRFELGGRAVEVFEIPGHTPGGCSFLDEKNRIIFSGDCCNINLLAPECSVTATLKAIEKFKSLSGRFDQNFNGHAGFGACPNCLSQPKSVPDDLIHICHDILEHKGTPFQFEFLGYPLTQMKYGNAKLSYDPDRLGD
jgi:hydroxyacylglutathione hydrolase